MNESKDEESSASVSVSVSATRHASNHNPNVDDEVNDNEDALSTASPRITAASMSASASASTSTSGETTTMVETNDNDNDNMDSSEDTCMPPSTAILGRSTTSNSSSSSSTDSECASPPPPLLVEQTTLSLSDCPRRSTRVLLSQDQLLSMTRGDEGTMDSDEDDDDDDESDSEESEQQHYQLHQKQQQQQQTEKEGANGNRNTNSNNEAPVGTQALRPPSLPPNTSGASQQQQQQQQHSSNTDNTATYAKLRTSASTRQAIIASMTPLEKTAAYAGTPLQRNGYGYRNSYRTEGHSDQQEFSSSQQQQVDHVPGATRVRGVDHAEEDSVDEDDDDASTLVPEPDPMVVTASAVSREDLEAQIRRQVLSEAIVAEQVVVEVLNEVSPTSFSTGRDDENDGTEVLTTAATATAMATGNTTGTTTTTAQHGLFSERRHGSRRGLSGAAAAAAVGTTSTSTSTTTGTSSRRGLGGGGVGQSHHSRRGRGHPENISSTAISTGTGPGATATASNNEDGLPKEKPRWRKWGWVAVCLVVWTGIVAGLMLGLMGSLGQSHSSSTSSSTSTSSSSSSKRKFASTGANGGGTANQRPPSASEQIVVTVSSSTLLPPREDSDELRTILTARSPLVNQTDTPQNQAYRWMVANQVAFDGNNGDWFWEKFALVTIFYSTGGPTSWNQTDDWLDNTVSPCNWYPGNLCQSLYESNSTDGGGRRQTLRGLQQTPPTRSMRSTIPPFVGVQTLDLSDHNLEGTIPDEIFLLSDLQVLEVEKNDRLTGTIPSTIGKLVKLQVFSAEWTGLTGTFPSDLGGLQQLRIFDMEGVSGMSGAPFPIDIWTLPKLKTLNLDDIGLTGSLPDTFLSPVEASLKNNHLSGTIPTTLSSISWRSLVLLDLRNNDLTGTIPDSLANIWNNNLLVLRLEGNDLRGTVQSPVCSAYETSVTVSGEGHVFTSDCARTGGQVQCSCCTSCCVDGQQCRAHIDTF